MSNVYFKPDVKARVKNILLTIPEARDNDAILLLSYWARHGLPELRNLLSQIIYDSGYDKLSKLASSETITRQRRVIQNNEGSLKPSLEKQKERGKLEELYRLNSKNF